MARKQHSRPKRYSPEFKEEALRLVASGTVTLTQVARELGIHVETLRLWRRQAGPATDRVAAASLEEENRRLRRENARLQEEREILKKATAFFARTAR